MPSLFFGHKMTMSNTVASASHFSSAQEPPMHQNATQDGCAFFRLAPEIRAKVYKQVFADATVGYRAKQKKRGYTSENRVIRGTLKDRFAATSILWTCRQCYQEAKPILHSEATLKIMSDTPITKDTAFYTHSRSFKNLQMEHVYRLSNLSPDWQKTHVDDALRSFPNTNTLILGEIYVEFSNPNGLFPGAFFRSGINIHDAVQLAWKADPLKSAWRKATQAISGEAMIENCRYLIRIRFQLPHQRPPAGSYSNWLIGDGVIDVRHGQLDYRLTAWLAPQDRSTIYGISKAP